MSNERFLFALSIIEHDNHFREEYNSAKVVFFFLILGEQCVNRASRSQWWMRYKMAEFITFYLVPVVLIVCVYLRICTVLWAKDPTLAVESKIFVMI